MCPQKSNTFVFETESTTFSGRHPLLCSLVILAFFLPNIEVNSSCPVSFASLPFSPLQWFDVPNHFQPRTPHERQQALAIIGCWKKLAMERTEKRDAKIESGGQGRNGDWMRSEMKPLPSSFPFQGLMLSLTLPFLPLPNYSPPSPPFSSTLHCILIVPMVPQLIGNRKEEIDLEAWEQ